MSPTPRIRVLYAEDEEMIRYVVTEIMTEGGMSVTQACDGQEAWDILSAGSFDIVLTDVNMPRMDGIELVNRMSDRFPMLPVVVLSGRPPADIATAFGQARRSIKVMMKPLRAHDLISVLESTLDANSRR